MREIIFRGKRVDNGTWAYGDLLHCDDEMEINSESLGENGGYIIPETVGQYTGLKDVHNTRVFEGDIVKVYDVYCNETVVGVVEFCDGSFRIYDKDFTSYDRWMLYGKAEVIGNIHDNPELLEVKEHE